MANQQLEIYDNYLKTFSKVVKPSVTENFPEALEDEEFELSTRYRKWGERSNTRVWFSSCGRVIEGEVIAWYKTLYATFETKEDWENYRKPLSMFHYLYT